MAEREHVTQTKTLKVLKFARCYAYKNAQNMMTEVGRPDITACVPIKISKLMELFGPDAKIGVFLGIEMKRPGKLSNTSEAQEIVGRQIKSAKGLWYAVDDPEQINKLLKELGVK